MDTGGEFSVEVAGVEALFENMVDLIALALSCDATRVVTLDVTIMQAMGMTPEEYEREPRRGFGEYHTIGKGDGFARDYDESNAGEALPNIWT